MKLEFVFNAFYYLYEDMIGKTEEIGQKLNDYLSDKVYVHEVKLDEISLWFINTENMKCRVRSSYRATVDHMDPYKYTVMKLFYEIPIPQSDFIKVSEKDMPTYIGKALLKVLETQNVPVKIRKQFDRERFISDVRDFFVNVKGCEL